MNPRAKKILLIMIISLSAVWIIPKFSGQTSNPCYKRDNTELYAVPGGTAYRGLVISLTLCNTNDTHNYTVMSAKTGKFLATFGNVTSISFQVGIVDAEIYEDNTLKLYVADTTLAKNVLVIFIPVIEVHS